MNSRGKVHTDRADASAGRSTYVNECFLVYVTHVTIVRLSHRAVKATHSLTYLLKRTFYLSAD